MSVILTGYGAQQFVLTQGFGGDAVVLTPVASKYEVFFLFNITTNAPVTGASPTFLMYKDDTGANLTQPAITEIGGGAYGFSPSFTANRGIVYVVDTGHNPSRVHRYIRPEDWANEAIAADVTFLRKLATNRWKIHTTGPNANQLIYFDDDNITPIYAIGLVPNAVDPNERTPV